MRDAFIVDALRTPVGKRNGGLSGVHPTDLGGFVMRSLVERTAIPAESVDDVIFGCANQIGSQAGNMARTCWLSAGLPESVPATTVDRRCGSGHQAIEFAAQGIMAGVNDLVIAGGVENMSMVPIGSPAQLGEAAGFGGQFTSEGWQKRYGDVPVSQFNGAETLAQRWDLSRAALEEFALASHQRAERAWAEGRFDAEVVPYREVAKDEGIRASTTLEKMAALNAVRENGRLTAATSSQISDAAAALLVASADACERYGLEPIARIHSSSVVGSDPILMLYGPVPATAKVLERAGLTIDDIGLYEVNEAFASVPMVWMAETGGTHDRLNVNGGAISLGHPLGATGARLMTTLVHEMRRTGTRFGLQAICEGGGTANATILELVSG